MTSVLPYPETSGSHKRTMRLIEAIARAGAAPHVLTEDAGDAGAAEALRSRGWIVEAVPGRPPDLRSRLGQHVARRPSPYLPGVAARLRELAFRAAFVQFEHAQNAYYWDAVGTARTVLSLHNVDSQMLASIARGSRGRTRLRMANRALAMRSVERRAVSRADVVLAVSDRDRRHFARSARTVLEIPNGIDEAFFATSPAIPETEDIVFFGNFNYPPNVMGIERFLRAGWPRIAAARPSARLVLVGKDLPAQLAAQIDGHPGVIRVGFVPDVAEILERSRMVLVPLWHGGGTRLKVLEALASGRPIASTPLGVEEIGVEPDRHSLVADDPERLADAALRLLSDAGLCRQLAGHGRELAERYRWSRVLAPAEDLYRAWLRDSAAPGPGS